mmetsp:Transcript_73802/g.173163  ORF Transcript_73802/g.173163 Transcript_73802/m.173163 type:complete len:268 (-) Transcript_73802:8-811(-)
MCKVDLQRYTSSCQPNPARLNGQHPARNEVASRRPAANVPNNGQTAQSSIQAVDEIVTDCHSHSMQAVPVHSAAWGIHVMVHSGSAEAQHPPNLLGEVPHQPAHMKRRVDRPVTCDVEAFHTTRSTAAVFSTLAQNRLARVSCAREVWDRSGTPLLSKEAHIAFGAKLEFWTQMDIIVGPLCTAAWASPGLLGYLGRRNTNLPRRNGLPQLPGFQANPKPNSDAPCQQACSHELQLVQLPHLDLELPKHVIIGTVRAGVGNHHALQL